ncbi:hypothetical protein NOR_05310 [Metarhizium rileyi]|uniref:Uncharacterized protein n=1 Tax=Metarhizium rileyi (strain RCEF 4871) TaxID=1649241 RepID=A0A167D0Q6_METRR|nr:hypothetical protein NOR_05310 [Metarhizium rileyi RCEF 4871]TWU70967.1 hypothetical protein ED733_001397 [Metarhizium rileyi]
MSTPELDSALTFNPKNEWDAKIGSRLTQLWEDCSPKWSVKKKADFRMLCHDANITYRTSNISSHKIHRRIQGRRATEAEYIVLAAIFGTDAVHRLSWAAPFKRRSGIYPKEGGVITAAFRKELKADSESLKTAAIREPQKKTPKPDVEQSLSGRTESPGSLHDSETTGDNELASQLPDKNDRNDGLVKTDQQFQNWIGKSMIEDVAEMKSEMKHISNVLREIKASTGFNERDAAAVKCETPERLTMDSIEHHSANTDEDTGEKANIKTQKEPQATRKRSPERYKASSPKRARTAGQQDNDIWETLHKARPAKVLTSKVEALEARCGAQEERIATLEASVSSKDDQLMTLRQQIDTIARFLAQSYEI